MIRVQDKADGVLKTIVATEVLAFLAATYMLHLVLYVISKLGITNLLFLKNLAHTL